MGSDGFKKSGIMVRSVHESAVCICKLVAYCNMDKSYTTSLQKNPELSLKGETSFSCVCLISQDYVRLFCFTMLAQTVI